ncbi:4'-phosphopantetheinyl transferase family protein [Actinophytocola algeriensis]|uniref:4'-phosphopantetheinyl transferase n=1 Tax=Actinophytocola algeriensis TaxID=1768010 RepID=A0A7W7QFA9_9PSEU|nr:4'-phosphopantetheinyl transferase superfamily protein [Actinophytocola algeriensis]MBB4912590.1 4'-phosphopantetheinyl transferase [Actinophytocola algeriensis]MBE1478964.1 4'-phosphopantetheinyl transferase [Actinophytocola algeriensis]
MRCDVWWAHPAAETAALLDLLDDIERTRYGNYRRDADKRRFLTGRALIRGVAAAELGKQPRDITIDSSCFDCGKPHGKPKVEGIEVSISHSGDWVALAVTDNAPVGVDVEEVRDAEIDGLAGIAFSPAELATFESVPRADRTGAFFTYWSRKEAVVKATGKGMTVPMSKLTLTAHDQPPRVVASDAAEVDVATVHMADLTPGDGYRASVAVFGGEAPAVTERDAADLIARLAVQV